MTESKPAAPSYSEPQRLIYSTEEVRHDWLPMLLDIYYITDQGVREGVRRQENKGRELACYKGCSSCCKAHTTIPVYPIEITGLYWYIIEQSKGEIRESLRKQCAAHEQGQPCPLLINGACGVHPMRPQACRHFNVFGNSCEEGEDAYYTRRGDVLTPIKKYKDEALSKMLPFHKINGRSQRRDAIKNNSLNQYVKVLQDIDWSKLSKRMP
jgi:uncharacterized protein